MTDMVRDDTANLEAQLAGEPDARVFARLAEAYRRSGRLERAAELLEQGTWRFPEHAPLQAALGRVRREERRFGEAEAAFRRALELEPRNRSVLVALAEMTMAHARNQAALAYYRGLRALDPENADAARRVRELEEALAGGQPPAEPAEPSVYRDPGASRPRRAPAPVSRDWEPPELDAAWTARAGAGDEVVTPYAWLEDAGEGEEEGVGGESISEYFQDLVDWQGGPGE